MQMPVRRAKRLSDREDLPKLKVGTGTHKNVWALQSLLYEEGATVEKTASEAFGKVSIAASMSLTVVFVHGSQLALPRGPALAGHSAKISEFRTAIGREGFANCPSEIALQLCRAIYDKTFPVMGKEVIVLSSAIETYDRANQTILGVRREYGRVVCADKTVRPEQVTLAGHIGSPNIRLPEDTWFAVCKRW